MKKLLLLAALPASLFFSCSESTETQEIETVVSESLSLTEAWSTDTTLITPESVILDVENNVLYVACINGVPPNAKDGDGYIAVLNLDGTIKEANWIAGMDAPKGMGIVEGMLYVADITKVHQIDIAKGEIINSFEVEGSEFLNDITVNGKTILISDSNTSTVYMLENGETSVLTQNDSFGGSNGLLAEGSDVYVAGFGSGDFHKMNYDTKELTLVADSIKGGDGIVKFGDKFIVSSWNGEIYSVDAAGNTNLLLDTKSSKRNAADIWLVEEKNLLLVPEFFANKVTAYTIK